MLLGRDLRGVQFGVESVQGTMVAANKLIKNTTLRNKRVNNVATAENEGHRAAIGQQRGKRWSEWTMTGKLGYNIMSYMAAGMFDPVAPTNPAAGAYTYTHADIYNTLHSPQTYTLEYGNTQGSNSKFAFGTFSEMTLNITETEQTYSAAGFGAYPTKNITLTTSPTIITPVLTNFGDFRLSYGTTFGSYTKLQLGKSIELSIKQRFKSDVFIDDATQSIGGIVELKPSATGRVVLAEGTESDIFLSALEVSTLLYLQLRATGPLIVTGTPNTYYSLLYTWATYMQDEDEGDTNKLFTGTYNFYTAEDITNNDINLAVTNTLSGY